MTDRKTGYELWEEAQEIASCWQALDAADEAGANDWADRVDAWAIESGDKAAAYRAVHRAARGRTMVLEAAAEAFATRAKRETKLAERMEGMVGMLLLAARDATGAAEVECQDGTRIRLRQRRSEAVLVRDQGALPEAYWRVKREPAKAEIKRALKAGIEVPGAELEQRVSERVDWGL
ncbi:MAG: siphovirus Gp157 family protein [Gemmatimonadales bacterium]|jgi:hypothetical protein